MQSIDVKENPTASDSGRMSMSDLKSATSVKTTMNSRKSVLGLSASSTQKLNIQSSTDDRRWQKSIQEKDRQIGALQKQLLLANDRAQDLQAESEKIKRQEREVKRLLSSKETSAKRQMILLKQAEDRLNSISGRDERKAKRSLLERKELEKQFEEIEIEYEEYIEFVQNEKEKDKQDMEGLLSKHEEEIRSIQAKYDDEVVSVRDEQLGELHHVQAQVEEYRALNEELSINITSLNEDIRKLSEDNDALRSSYEEQLSCNNNLQHTLSENTSSLEKKMKDIHDRDHDICKLNQSIVHMTAAYEEKCMSYEVKMKQDVDVYAKEIQLRDETVKAIKMDLEDAVARMIVLEEKYQSNLVTLDHMKSNLMQYEAQDEENHQTIAKLEASLSSSMQSYDHDVKDIQDMNMKLQASLSLYEAENIMLKDSVMVMKNDADAFKIMFDDMVGKHQAAINKHQSHITMLEEKYMTKSSAYEKLEHEMHRMDEVIQDLTMQVSSYKQSIIELEQARQKIIGEHNELEVELQTMLADLKKQREEFAAKLVLMNELRDQQQLEDRHRETQSYEKQLQAKASSIMELQQMYDGACEAKARCEDRILELEQTNQDVIHEVSSLSQKLAGERDHYEAVIMTNEGVVANLHATIMELRCMQVDSSSMMSDYKDLMMTKEQEIDALRKDVMNLQQQAGRNESNASYMMNMMNDEMMHAIEMKEQAIASLSHDKDMMMAELKDMMIKKDEAIASLSHDKNVMISELKDQVNMKDEMMSAIEAKEQSIASLSHDKDKITSELLMMKEEMMSAIEAKDGAIATLSHDKDMMTAELKESKDRYDAMIIEHETLSSTITSLQQQIDMTSSDMHHQAEELQHRISAAEHDKQMMLSSYNAETSTLQDTISIMQHEVTSLSSMKASLEHELMMLNKKMHMLEESSSAMMSDQHNQHLALDQAKDKTITELQSFNVMLEQHLVEERGSVKSLQDSLHGAQHEVTSLSCRLKEQDIINKQAMDDMIAAYDASHMTKDKHLASLAQEHDAMRMTLEEKTSCVMKLEQDIISLQGSVQAYKQAAMDAEDRGYKTVEELTHLHETCEEVKDNMISSLRKQIEDNTSTINTLKQKLQDQDLMHHRAVELHKSRYDASLANKDVTIKELRDQQVDMMQAVAAMKDRALSHEDATIKTMQAMKDQHHVDMQSKDMMIAELRAQYDALMQEAAINMGNHFNADPRVQALEHDLQQSRATIEELNHAITMKLDSTHEAHTREELNATRIELMRVREEYERLAGEHAYLLSSSSDNQQKIHYVWTLKKQISDLLEENTRLRSRVVSFVVPDKQYI